MAGPGTREKLLAKLRAAAPSGGNRETDWQALPRAYSRAGTRNADARIALLAERLKDYDADVVETPAQDLPATIAAVLARSGRKTFVVPSALPAAWQVEGYAWRRDDGLSHAAIDAADGVVTAAAWAVADSGTIALHHGPQEGRRVLTLLPDWHLIVLHVRRIVETLPEYFAAVGEPPRLVTWISGPSATADIEMTRIKGVHGPRFLSVIIVRDDA